MCQASSHTGRRCSGQPYRNPDKAGLLSQTEQLTGLFELSWILPGAMIDECGASCPRMAAHIALMWPAMWTIKNTHRRFDSTAT